MQRKKENSKACLYIYGMPTLWGCSIPLMGWNLGFPGTHQAYFSLSKETNVHVPDIRFLDRTSRVHVSADMPYIISSVDYRWEMAELIGDVILFLNVPYCILSSYHWGNDLWMALLYMCRIDHPPRFMLPLVVDLPWATCLAVVGTDLLYLLSIVQHI
jgi:hypothetical protein